MSLFRKPKKIQRRALTSTLDDEEDAVKNDNQLEKMQDDAMDLEVQAPPPPQISSKVKKKKNHKEMKVKPSSSKDNSTTKSLLSFADEEEDGEVFQVRKSSHSKKVMRMLDKERRRKKKEERDTSTSIMAVDGYAEQSYHNRDTRENGSRLSITHSLGSTTTSIGGSTEHRKSNKDKIQTEIRTDDFVLVVKKSEPDIILNGRAALCAGRNDMSDDDEYDGDVNERNHVDKHRFNKPDHLKKMLESGSIPDASMIHAARKRRQKAREQGDCAPIEEHKIDTKKGNRLTHEDLEEDNSDEEQRIDMNVITGVKEREERREQFYAVEKNYSDEDSDCETHEWENQQIRKGVTGAQLVNAQHESVLSRFMIKSSASLSNTLENEPTSKSTSSLLEQAYAKCTLEKPQQLLSSSKVKKDKTKSSSLRTPQEIREALEIRLSKLKELNRAHQDDIEHIAKEMKSLKLEEMDCKQKAPTAAAKYRFYQEIKCYVSDLIDCLNEKVPLINDLEKRMLQFFAKHHNFLIERRRQDVRDQAKEMAEAAKPSSSRRGAESEEQMRRATEREGRRTRRRCERERNDLLSSHLDGMSSDEETSDRYQEQFQNNLEMLDKEALDLLEDVNDEFCKVEIILKKFYAWRKTDYDSYKDAFVSLCLPKVLGPLVRLEILSWSPLLTDYKDIEKLNWYPACMLYAWNEEETEATLKQDSDNNLVPTIIEKIILPKITEIVNQCWDPLSTTKTLRLIGFINRLGRDYPLKESSKQLQQLFNAILEKMKLALENDVFIPIFPKQVQENKTSFFQRQFCTGLKLFRNFLSWQGIVADKPLREMAINSLLNRYLLMALRVCSFNDAISKAYMIVNILPTAWLQPHMETLKTLESFIMHIKAIVDASDSTNPAFMQSVEKAKLILQRLHHSV
ncbi:PAX3- and PAX7-binding protein 1 isoform X1 [Glossina fuscipes]|uniref:PAX3- and PAX7-binding protein 1 isoform X1 n=1 Tax=Glossina fuscipes TaxID=7396 RepID=A0A9C5YZY1_9MUSC|nr:PAX3- and PAX7-binding protein 1 isoform X1 [Glossina fuscipes]